jgi:hypothetical protein
VRALFSALALLALWAGPGSAQTHILIVSGTGGETRYSDSFHEWGTSMVDAARTRLGLPRENVVYLAEDPSRDPERINASSRREDVESAIRGLAGRAGADDPVLILLIGHGSMDSRGARINLPGPDINAEELAELLSLFRTQPLVVVNTASASGGFQEPLAGPNRTIITATRTGMERNETIFGGYFVEAFAQDGADADRDGRVSIQEAFDYAVRETQRAYQTTNRLQMEHARMEGDTELAGRFRLGGRAALVADDAPPALRALFAERQRLEDEIAGLRVRAGQLEPAAYEAELERLLLELARTNREIRELEGAG